MLFCVEHYASFTSLFDQQFSLCARHAKLLAGPCAGAQRVKYGDGPRLAGVHAQAARPCRPAGVGNNRRLFRHHMRSGRINGRRRR